MPQRLPGDRTRGAIRLAVAMAVIATVWLGVLPHVGMLAAVREFVRGNEAAGINPSAMYYTEVEAMGAVAERVERREGSVETAFRMMSQDSRRSTRVVE